MVASGHLGDAPWPGTDALFWAEIELARAGRSRGSSRLRCASTRRNSTSRIEGASSPFNVSVVARPEHTLTVKVVADGVPVEEAIVRLGPYRATTDAAGVAAVKLAKGRYELVVWKAGYDAPPVPLTIDADAFVRSMRARCRRTIPTRSGRRERRAIGAGLSNRNPAP